MEINKIFSKIIPSKVDKNSAIKKANGIEDNDKITLSGNVKNYAEQKKYIEIVKQAPDIRQDVVNKVLEKIKNDDYFDKVDLNKLAEKMIENEDN